LLPRLPVRGVHPGSGPHGLPRIDGLRLGRALGHGGMGAVYRALDLRTGQQVVVKVPVMTPVSPTVRRRFACEVAAMAAVHDPHVVSLRSSGDAEGVPYAVLDRIRGLSLDRMAMPLVRPFAAHLSIQLAEAVQAVHVAGYLHRDIKPANVLVGRGGWVTLIDLGLARPCADGAALGSSAELTLTEPGTCVGTRRYLAPELLAGEPATVRSDLFAVGLVIEQLFGPADPDHDLGDPVDELVAWCRARAPADRPASARAVAAALRRLDPGGPRPAAPAPRSDPPTWRESACDLPTVNTRGPRR
jgi:eukaryotic-like serine/threonine-protein kinase